jgi:hypothetical protein
MTVATSLGNGVELMGDPLARERVVVARRLTWKCSPAQPSRSRRRTGCGCRAGVERRFQKLIASCLNATDEWVRGLAGIIRAT